MQLTINGERRSLTDIREFRQRHDLPQTFNLAQFEPKDFSGLGSIERAGTALNQVRQAVLDAVPTSLTIFDLPVLIDKLGEVYARKLLEINPQVKLREVEIEFAVAGFEDLNRALLYTLMQARVLGTTPPPFEAIYGQWLDDTSRISQRIHDYARNGTHWQVRVINTVYGRAGLIVEDGVETAYLYDSSLACPAEGFMYNLLKDLAESIMNAVQRG